MKDFLSCTKRELKAFEHKKCLFCGSKQVKKNGTRDGKQRYKCTACNKRFSGGQKLNPNTTFGSATAKTSKAPHSLPCSTDAASKRSIATSAKPLHRANARCHRHP